MKIVLNTFIKVKLLMCSNNQALCPRRQREWICSCTFFSLETVGIWMVSFIPSLSLLTTGQEAGRDHELVWITGRTENSWPWLSQIWLTCHSWLIICILNTKWVYLYRGDFNAQTRVKILTIIYNEIEKLFSSCIEWTNGWDFLLQFHTSKLPYIFMVYCLMN
jgi:hypothetical protein